MILDNFYYQLSVIATIGLLFGSFYNVVIFRSLKKQSIIYPPSTCPDCNNRLLWWHNIPIVSYLFLRGKCYFCKNPISLQYPTVELITTLLFVGMFIKFGLTLVFFKQVFILSLLLVLAIIDIKQKEIPIHLTIIFAFSLLFGKINFVALGSVLLVAYCSKFILDKIFKKTLIGEGDIIVLSILAGIGDINILKLFGLILITHFVICLPSFIKKYGVLKSGMLFFVSYSILFAHKIYQFECNNYLLGFVCILLLSSLFFFVRTLIKNIKNAQNETRIPLIPAIFVGYLIMVLL